ncbi:hypothetical protein CC80DRAFT_82721 [Byssothecium circinans]|uniref:Rhodopsin domain-containing protein n=1 Tax=Byssothecium circinans TaxID=147558 RepID=A0A6A5TV96_9PLEO|nr:hypothetical protein CC80DRAFT_82721 [Byssothecium circinans]
MPIFLANQPKANKIQYAFAVEYNAIMMTTKLSFLLSLQNLRSRNKWITRSLWTIQIINLLSGIMSTFFNAFPCQPLVKVYTPTLPGHCLDPFKIVIGCVTAVLATDIMVLAMPTWIIHDLKMPLKKKILSIGFLSIGVIVIIIGVLRVIWLANVFRGVFNTHSVEQSYSAIESNVAIIGASGPTVKYIFGFVVPCLKSDGKASKRSAAYGYGYGYGVSESVGADSRPGLSKYRSRAGYDDLRDSESLNRRDIGMEGGSEWKWKRTEEDARSDEQRITGMGESIVKTVDWKVSSRESRERKGMGESDASVSASASASALAVKAVQPAHVV